jgi:hypothetical protein
VIKICDLPYQVIRFDGRDFRAFAAANPYACGTSYETRRVEPTAIQGPISPSQADAILGELCRRAERIYRWQGRRNPHGRSISVAEHSLLVAWIVSQDHPEASRWAAAHDLGETLGLGDPAAPWLDLYPGLRVAHHEHQAAVDRLIGDCPPETRKLVHEADVMAREVESAYLGEIDPEGFPSLRIRRLDPHWRTSPLAQALGHDDSQALLALLDRQVLAVYGLEFRRLCGA